MKPALAASRPTAMPRKLSDPRFQVACNLLILAVLAVDRLTKAWAMGWLASHGTVPVFPFFQLTYVENTGAAFGVLYGGNAFLVVLAAALIVALAVWRRKLQPHERLTRLGVSLVLAGAVGNLYDRLAYGYVVDFLDFRVWPVFNAADSAITIGAVLLAFTAWRHDRK